MTACLRLWNLRHGMLLGLFALLTGVAMLSPPAKAASVDREFQLKAGELLAWCRKQGYKSAGVLKFRVQVGSQPVSDNAGTLNLALANKLEIALILAEDVRNPIDIVRDASSVVATDKMANHLTPAGQARLFQHKYPMAWGDKEITPDVLFTGLAKLSPDMSQMSVRICAIPNDGTGLCTVMDVKAAPTPLALASSGRSFLRGLRGASFGSLKTESEKEFIERQKKEAFEVKKEAEKVQKGEAPHPLKSAALPVTLEVYYGGKPVPYEFAGSEARIPEPPQGTPVAFRLVRTDKSDQTYGVVLKVNGENTLYQEREQDLHCTRWILQPGDPPIPVNGFQLDGGSAVPFVVLSPEESKANEINYGKDVGTITLTIFQQKPGSKIVAAAPTPPTGAGTPLATPPSSPSTPPSPATPPATPTQPANNNPLPPDNPPPDLPQSEVGSPEEAAPLRSIQRGTLGKKQKAPSLAALKMELRSTSAATRGLIVKGGAVIESNIQVVSFEPDPVPVASVVIRYYKGAKP